MTRILGVDPGSRTTGFGVIEVRAQRIVHVASGCIRVRGASLAARLKCIFDGMYEVMERHRPVEVVIEEVFMHRNAASALKLGHARSAAMLAAVIAGLSVHEYAPAAVKQAITGRGNADKMQVQHMVKLLLSLASLPPEDAADALAAALCHAHRQQTLDRVRQRNPALVQ